MKIRSTYPWNKGSPSSFDNLNWSFGVFCGFWPETCWKSINDILKSWLNGLASRRKFVSTDLRNGEKTLRRLAYEFQLDQNQRKLAKRNTSWTQFENLRWLASTCESVWAELKKTSGWFLLMLCWAWKGHKFSHPILQLISLHKEGPSEYLTVINKLRNSTYPGLNTIIPYYMKFSRHFNFANFATVKKSRN